MNWLTIFNELFDILFLTSLLVFLILIWRSSERRLRHAEKMERTIIDVGMKDAESARIVAESVRTLAAVVQNEQAR